MATNPSNAEQHRLEESSERIQNWQRWGPYLSERQWGTVREDYSQDQNAWFYFPHDHARSRAYRWGEDGLLGICDRQCRLCFSFAFWNGKDSILKERLFGLAGPEGNHGEDVKECYYYIDSTPTHTYMKAIYKYPQAAFPYIELLDQNKKRSKLETEFELEDCGVFEDNRYFDCVIEYAKNSPDDILVKATVTNRGPEVAEIHVLQQWWYHNTWTWDCNYEGCAPRPTMRLVNDESMGAHVDSHHVTLGHWRMAAGPTSDGQPTQYLFTDNETNTERHPGVLSTGEYFKDAFHRLVIDGEQTAINPKQTGTKVAGYTTHQLQPGRSVVLRGRMTSADSSPKDWFEADFEDTFNLRKQEADAFYTANIPSTMTTEETRVARQAYAGLMWTKQFYHYVVEAWIDGDASFGREIPGRDTGRNSDWPHLFNRDVISMPDKWEYPWYAAWDLAFHMLPLARIDQRFAEDQLVLFLREWYMSPNGALPAYEWALSDVNPPVHAWACWSVYQTSGNSDGYGKNVPFLARTFQKLLINFTWWVNRKDPHGNNIFSGGFLGLDNIGVFDRSKPFPTGGELRQADATAWMAFFCGTMLKMALELAHESVAYADMASKFLEHYLSIAQATNALHGIGLWDEVDGFYYDHLEIDGTRVPLKVRSLVGLIPICGPVILDERKIADLAGFKKRTDWFLANRGHMAQDMSYLTRVCPEGEEYGLRLLALPNEQRLRRLLVTMLDEREFLSPYGIRSLSAAHGDQPFEFSYNGYSNKVAYVPGESDSGMFGGNSNWRGPIWFPINYLLIESLRTYHIFYGDSFQLECPTGSGILCNLDQIADEIQRRLINIFVPTDGRRACHGSAQQYAECEHWRDLVLFYEYFHGDDGHGLGASHQTGWTALVATLLEQQAMRR